MGNMVQNQASDNQEFVHVEGNGQVCPRACSVHDESDLVAGKERAVIASNLARLPPGPIRFQEYMYIPSQIPKAQIRAYATPSSMTPSSMHACFTTS
ncbi:hypothetical protein PanWU01x14_207860 [Parasponia andersonii]|uniref:Uncharacterized protein n=1 Tax=Parasponia andersonii TaxID=3476 RepID=A0A2P5BV77_PARAD|nr:hypothetical protein PanWU01x14_207860 [Parasponia andersonii]